MHLDVFECTGARIAENGALDRYNALVLIATSGLHCPQGSACLAIDFPICISVVVTDRDGEAAIVGSNDVQIQVMAAGDV